ncbi:hypothetical protein WH5701_12208 [Synechococcus sp. WH 5701]|uniref:hypothetical protein n=1 Tax=unclassified Synechococcus TaxID=2626047 RepID=UPI0000698F70|nr:hypothetical protein [Synechococcus sp. CCFWC 502]EAQ74074.1 hypothetical protein WH5701_12208 [Synechococcus sp. WH 5701]WFN58350.1 hypothetical protein N4320_11090 [Synechococcus sp. CCFWC 502]
MPDVNTTLDDWPCLEDVLEGGSFHATSDWLQLLNGLTEDLQERATGCLIHKAVRRQRQTQRPCPGGGATAVAGGG